MKKTGMAKSDAKKLMGKMTAPGAAEFGKVAEVVDRREQRRRDQALGLVPFATKLNADLVAQINALAAEQGTDVGTVVTALLQKGMAN
ncbi:hypothetical protein [Pseudoduganella aquatica]|uniref:LexA regulated protein n=1 Tax=Pseudoduganella aquatica TaxID=2660641 RepID=A0A7X4HGD5_9BURK|nr:hypothetical protein [Pseudoduganella aquatica]MYN10459.1 hypothetical protein [Pseudoduganella aquatica]